MSHLHPMNFGFRVHDSSGTSSSKDSADSDLLMLDAIAGQGEVFEPKNGCVQEGVCHEQLKHHEQQEQRDQRKQREQKRQ